MIDSFQEKKITIRTQNESVLYDPETQPALNRWSITNSPDSIQCQLIVIREMPKHSPPQKQSGFFPSWLHCRVTNDWTFGLECSETPDINSESDKRRRDMDTHTHTCTDLLLTHGHTHTQICEPDTQGKLWSHECWKRLFKWPSALKGFDLKACPDISDMYTIWRRLCPLSARL